MYVLYTSKLYLFLPPFHRSCGYQFRPSIPIAHIKTLCDHLTTHHKTHGRDLVVFVDNCYGELVEEAEPCHVGADLVAGSLIKNLGGTLAPCGGYIAGKRCDVMRVFFSFLRAGKCVVICCVRCVNVYAVNL